MGEAIRFGNTPATVRAYLLGALDAVEVCAGSIPNPRPAKFVMLEPAGGDDLSVIHDGQIVIVDSWGATSREAYDLAQDVRAYLKAMRNYQSADGQLIYSANSLGGVVWMPDPDAKAPRFRQNFRFVTRGRAIPNQP